LATNGVVIYCDNSSPKITNCIVWNDSQPEIWANYNSTPIVTCSDIKGGYEGDGNIDEDPRFIDAAVGNFHLSADSPCIDAGITDEDIPDIDIPDYDKDGNPRDEYPDMGAYEYISQSIGKYRHQTRIRDNPCEDQESRRPSCSHPWR